MRLEKRVFSAQHHVEPPRPTIQNRQLAGFGITMLDCLEQKA